MFKKITQSLLLVGALFSPLQASAQDTFYGFFDVGFVRYDLSFVDEAASGFSAGGGIRLGEKLAVELAYNDYGPADIRSPSGVEGEYDLKSGSLSANLGNFYVGQSGNRLYGIVGVEFLDSDQEFIPASTLTSIDVDDNEIDAMAGVGLSLGDESQFATARLRLTAHSGGDILRLSIGVNLN